MNTTARRALVPLLMFVAVGVACLLQRVVTQHPSALRHALRASTVIDRSVALAAPTQCTGVSDSCTGRPAGWCTSQSGCSAEWHPNADGDFEFACTRQPSSCSSLSSERACQRQAGCSWR